MKQNEPRLDLSDKKTAIAAKLDQRNYVEHAKYGLELHGSMKLGWMY